MRRNSYRGKYQLSKAQYLSAKYYAPRYNEYVDEYHALEDSSKGIAYDKDRVSGSQTDPTELLGMKRAELSQKIKIIEQTAIEADPDLYQYILKAVTNEGITFKALKSLMEIPCEADMFYDRRRRYYWLLSKRI